MTGVVGDQLMPSVPRLTLTDEEGWELIVKQFCDPSDGGSPYLQLSDGSDWIELDRKLITDLIPVLQRWLDTGSVLPAEDSGGRPIAV